MICPSGTETHLFGPVPLQNSAQGCDLGFWPDGRVKAGSRFVPLRLLYLIMSRVFAWLLLLGRSQGCEDHDAPPCRAVSTGVPTAAR